MYSILLLDDDPDDQFLFREALCNIDPGILLHIAGDGEAGLELLAQMEPKPDLIITDINMPRLSGIEFVTAIKQILDLQDIPVVLISTSGNVRYGKEIQRLGAIFFTKPTEFKELQQIILEGIRLILPKGG